MSSPLARWLAGVLIASCALGIAGPASARGHKQPFFRLELGTGKVQAVSQGAEPPAARWPSPATDARRSITSDERTLLVYDEAPDPARRKILWQYTVPGSSTGSIPWRVLQGNTVAYAWREEVPDQRSEYRDIVRAVDMPGKKLLWERVLPAHDPAEAAGIGTDHLVVDQPKEVLILETRTGHEIRRLARSEPSFAVTRPGPGRIWIQAGGVLECIDEATTRTIWRTSQQGQLLWLQPIPSSGDWLVKTASHAYRVRAADGHAVWSTPSAASSRPLLHGDRLYEGTLVADRSRRHAQMIVIERDLRSGKTVREYPIGAHDAFFDQGDVTAVAARDGWIDVAADFTILD